MWLSHHFHLSEFINSNEAKRRGINNIPPREVIDRLTDLCENVLEPIRSNFATPVKISSGYRSPELNRAIGGSMNSQHVFGMAADFEITGLDNCELAFWVADNIEFDQLILEFHDHSVGPNDGWVHVSYDSGNNRRQILTATYEGGKVVYHRGLVL
jgi:zinc D-Ala-D-Ala carboxypeptidase